MSFITGSTVFWRVVILMLLFISLMGPWMFDLIHVPAEYTCGLPFVRLYGDFCGSPVSGLEAMKWFGGGLFYTWRELIRGNFAARIPELLFPMGILIIVFPFLSSLLLIGKQGSLRLQLLNMIAWGLAGLLASTMFFYQAGRGQFAQFFSLLWGLRLYILLAIGALGFESLVFKSDRSPSMAI